MKVTYVKLRDGGWGLRVIDGTCEQGQEVEVTTKGGAVKLERIGTQVWTGHDNYGKLVTLYAKYNPNPNDPNDGVQQKTPQPQTEDSMPGW